MIQFYLCGKYGKYGKYRWKFFFIPKFYIQYLSDILTILTHLKTYLPILTSILPD